MKSLLSRFQQIVSELKKKDVAFAVAGGLAASLYRDQHRLTYDIDLAVAFSIPVVNLEEILEDLDLSVTRLTEADLKGGPQHLVRSRKSPLSIVVGRSDTGVGIDFLLPHLPWVDKAINRAANNQVDFGFGPIPTVTAEDLLLSKFYAVSSRSSRYKDLDDIQSIFRAQKTLDLPYLASEMRSLKVVAPKEIEEIPAVLKQISRELTKKM